MAYLHDKPNDRKQVEKCYDIRDDTNVANVSDNLKDHFGDGRIQTVKPEQE